MELWRRHSGSSESVHSQRKQPSGHVPLIAELASAIGSKNWSWRDMELSALGEICGDVADPSRVGMYATARAAMMIAIVL